MKKKVLVALSGGVDSSVAAALLKKKGYEVTGITMCLGVPDAKTKKPSCCGAQGISDAKRVADELGIRHHVVNFGSVMEEKVIRNFLAEYRAGRTPNPCVRCNEMIKFGLFFEKMAMHGCDFFATGHYARLAKSGSQYFLRKAKDPKKDQSYFLYRLTQDRLKYLLFPIGGYLKTEVRTLARKLRLSVAEKNESQDICFIGTSFKEYMKERLKESAKPGPIVDSSGKVLGQHAGIAFYTIGQRDGLGVACGHPVYVSAIDAAANRICVGPREELFKQRFTVRDMVYPAGALRHKAVFGVRVRHVAGESLAEIIPSDKGTCEVCFKEPVFAITPGQSAVFYKKDLVVGGGIIEKVLS
jgi:tRNA-specific 2-thiouridylase